MSALNAILADASRFARMIEPLLQFVSVAQKATGLGGSTAELAVSVIINGLQALERIAAGEITAEQARMLLAEIETRLDGHLADDDAAADAKLADRFR